MNFIEQIKELALEKYEHGWDFIVECYSDEELIAELEEHKCFSFEEAKEHLSQLVELRNEKMQEIRAEIF